LSFGLSSPPWPRREDRRLRSSSCRCDVWSCGRPQIRGLKAPCSASRRGETVHRVPVERLPHPGPVMQRQVRQGHDGFVDLVRIVFHGTVLERALKISDERTLRTFLSTSRSRQYAATLPPGPAADMPRLPTANGFADASPAGRRVIPSASTEPGARTRRK